MILPRKALARALFAAGIALATVGFPPGRASAGKADEPVLHSGDRVVFYGDSITEQRLYTRYVQQYVRVRHPDWDLRFWNAGWGGDTAEGARARLARDVLPLKPTVVTLFFGMNDGGYRAPDEGVRTRYRAAMDGLVQDLVARGVRVVVFGPGCVDPDKNAPLGPAHYNETLEGLSQVARDVAKKRGARFHDVHDPMLAYQTARKRAEPAFTMIPDGVHPNAEGHLVMARAMLEGLGAEPMPPLGSADLSSRKAEGLSIVASTPDEVVLETQGPVAAPFWFEAGSARAAAESGLLESLAGPRLIVKGLPGGTWEVTIADGVVGTFAAGALAEGATVLPTWGSRGKTVHDLIAAKETAYFTAWRQVRVPLGDTPGVDKALASMLDADAALDAAIQTAAAPEKLRLVLTPAPATENLAWKRPYETSDPNTFGWGNGGLTDGSWGSDSAHCFATGNAAKFPKTVTVDLGKVERLALVRLGVPDFGATKTVVVSIGSDGKSFDEVGRVEFAQGAEARRSVRFAPHAARYVRLTYPDHHDATVGYPPEFAFTRELEVYGAK